MARHSQGKDETLAKDTANEISAEDIKNAINCMSQVTMIITVDGNRTDDYIEDGSISRPYKTIQNALNVIPLGNDSIGARKVYQIDIVSGTYDEDLTYDMARKRLVINCMGAVNIGQFNSSNWSPSGTPRNITIGCSLASIDSIRPFFAIISNSPNASYGTHQAYSSNVRLSGTLTINPTVSVSKEWLFLGLNIFGWDGVAIGNNPSISCVGLGGNLNTFMYGCRIYGEITGGQVRLQHALNCEFSKLISLATYSMIRESIVSAGMTWTVAPSEVPPCGIFDSALTGTFTGSIGNNLLVNKVTKSLSTITIAGGSSIVVLDGSYNASDVLNDSSVIGTTVKDALNTLDSNKVNGTGISGFFTTVDGKTVTITNGVVTSIV